MNDINRNSRTLIVSFVVAIFTLIPLRFYEVGSQVANSRSKVLGTQREVNIVLPEDGLSSQSAPVLEFPYEEIESSTDVVETKTDCMTREEVDKVVGNLTEILKTPGLDKELVTAAMEEIDRVEGNVCR